MTSKYMKNAPYHYHQGDANQNHEVMPSHLRETLTSNQMKQKGGMDLGSKELSYTGGGNIN